jgi:hypothetical protein
LVRSRFRAALVAALSVAAAAELGAQCSSPPSGPVNVYLRSSAPSSLEIGWIDTSAGESGFELDFRLSSACATCFTKTYVGPNVTSRVLGGLNEGASYAVRVRAWKCATPVQPPCVGNASAPTTPVTFTTRLFAPTQVRAVDRRGAAGVTVAWSDLSGIETEYRIERRASWEAGFRSIALVPPGPSYFEDKPRFEGTVWEEGALDWSRYEYRVTARRRTPEGAVLATSNAIPASVETSWGDTSLESCSLLAVRPDQRMSVNDYPNRCIPVWSVARLADSNARIALIGGQDVANPLFTPYPRGCAGVAFPYDADRDGVPFGATYRDLGAYVSAVKARRAARGGPPIEFVHEHRFDLLGTPLLAQPEYQRSFVLRTATPFSAVLGFFAGDTSAECTSASPPGGCAFHADAELYTEQYPYYHDKRIQDFVDAHGPGDDHKYVVYYMSRSWRNPKWHSPLAILADQRVPAYRAWRVSEAAKVKSLGAIDFVELNHKLNQYTPSDPHWLGAPQFENVHEVNVSGDTPWSAAPSAYGLAEYVQGWRALASDLRAAGVPFAVNAGPYFFRSDATYDDPQTSQDEQDLVRDATRDASLILLGRYKLSGTTDAQFRDLVGELRGELAPRGGRVVVIESQPNPGDACPYQGQ